MSHIKLRKPKWTRSSLRWKAWLIEQIHTNCIVSVKCSFGLRSLYSLSMLDGFWQHSKYSNDETNMWLRKLLYRQCCFSFLNSLHLSTNNPKSILVFQWHYSSYESLKVQWSILIPQHKGLRDTWIGMMWGILQVNLKKALQWF